jgi:hypothetical protein
MPFDPVDHEFRVEAIEKIGRVIGLLSARERWCKRRLKTEDGRMCILGAVREADAELLLYAPILKAIREVTGHAYRRIEHFNDSWVSTHPIVLDVLEHARAQLAIGLVPLPEIFQQRASSPAARPSLMRRLIARWRGEAAPEQRGNPCS